MTRDPYRRCCPRGRALLRTVISPWLQNIPQLALALHLNQVDRLSIHLPSWLTWTVAHISVFQQLCILLRGLLDHLCVVDSNSQGLVATRLTEETCQANS